MTLTQWSEAQDSSLEQPIGPCSTQAELVYWERLDYYEPPPSMYIRYSCGYVGFIAPVGQTCLVKVEVDSGQIRLSTPIPAQGPGCSTVTQRTYSLTESCDPYYGDTGELLGEFVIHGIDLGCGNETYRLRNILTE